MSVKLLLHKYKQTGDKRTTVTKLEVVDLVAKLTGTRRHTIVAILAAVLLLFTTFPTNAYATSSSEVKAQADELMKQIDSIQSQISAAQTEYDDAMNAYNDATKAIDAAQDKIDSCEKIISANKEKIKSRAVSIYRNGELSMIDVLLGSTSFNEFCTLMTQVQYINDYNNAVIEESRTAKAESEAARTEMQAQQKTAQDEMKTAETAKNELTQKTAEIQTEVSKLNSEAAELQAEEEAREAAAEAARKAAQQQGSAGEDVITGNGQFSHPCPGYSSISSTFGYRTFDNSFHKGMDFAAPAGTPIYAADAGTVVIAGYSSSAGNWVVISHGDGLTTKYMHMVSTPYVSAGDYVSRGQNIGAVGTTGNSSGNHLHFQVEVNGTAVNPASYL